MKTKTVVPIDLRQWPIDGESTATITNTRLGLDSIKMASFGSYCVLPDLELRQTTVLFAAGACESLKTVTASQPVAEFAAPVVSA